MTCSATGQLGPDDLLVCVLEAPHPGVMHLDRVRGLWWGTTDDGLTTYASSAYPNSGQS
jgi:hypothetical protein